MYKNKMTDESTATVEELQTEYESVVGKPAAGPHKNKPEWLQGKIQEANSTEQVEEPRSEEAEKSEEKPKALTPDEEKASLQVKLNNTGLLIPRKEFNSKNVGSKNKPGILSILGAEEMVTTYTDLRGNKQPLQYISARVAIGEEKWMELNINGLQYFVRVNYPLRLPYSLACQIGDLINQEAKIQTPSPIMVLDAGTGQTMSKGEAPEASKLF